MENTAAMPRPAWLTDDDELPHDIGGAPPGWTENYLGNFWDPAAGVGVYVHLTRRSDPFPLWDEQVLVALPGDRYLTAKGFAAGRDGEGPAVVGIDFRCDEPYVRWTKRFRGAARLLDGDTYRSAPVGDGPHVFVEWELEYVALSPAFDLGSEPVDLAWASRHYEQHHAVRGWLTVGGGERYELSGTGLRDHSWGVRDYATVGTTTWLQGQFVESGRHLMLMQVAGYPGRPAFVRGFTGDRTSVVPIAPGEMPFARTFEEATADCRIELDRDGECSVLDARILAYVHGGFTGPAEIVVGRCSPADASHHYVEAFTRFEWDGEVGYGMTARTVDLQDHTRPEDPR
ncbi:MAG: hypothetical protein AB7G37_06195 [Solirubrobacteraceae bacterium]